MKNQNFKITFDQDIHDILSHLPYHQVTWNESDPEDACNFPNPQEVEPLLKSTQAIIASKYLSNNNDVKPIYSRVWKGKTDNGSNREYHSDKLFEIWNDNRSPEEVSNIIFLYYHCDLSKSGAGLRFWNRSTDEKVSIYPSFGDLVIIDEREDEIWHKVIDGKDCASRYVVGFGFYLS